MGEGEGEKGRESARAHGTSFRRVLKVQLRFVWKGNLSVYYVHDRHLVLRAGFVHSERRKRPGLAGYEVDSEDFMDFCRSGEDLFLTPDEAVIEVWRGGTTFT